MEKRWRILQAEEDRVNDLQQALGINKIICKILVQRGLSTFKDAKSYYRPQLSDLHDPWLMKDMKKAVDRIVQAIENREKILVFGDYDVDGTTSVATVFQFLKKIHDPSLLDYYIPHRYREGYGISKRGIDYANENGFSLVI